MQKITPNLWFDDQVEGVSPESLDALVEEA